MENIFIQEKLMLWLTFNPVLALSDFRTIQPYKYLIFSQVSQQWLMLPLSCFYEKGTLSVVFTSEINVSGHKSKRPWLCCLKPYTESQRCKTMIQNGCVSIVWYVFCLEWQIEVSCEEKKEKEEKTLVLNEITKHCKRRNSFNFNIFFNFNICPKKPFPVPFASVS